MAYYDPKFEKRVPRRTRFYILPIAASVMDIAHKALAYYHQRDVHGPEHAACDLIGFILRDGTYMACPPFSCATLAHIVGRVPEPRCAVLTSPWPGMHMCKMLCADNYRHAVYLHSKMIGADELEPVIARYALEGTP